MANSLPDDYVPNKARSFISSLVYARDEYLDTLTMMLLLSHARDAVTTVPHLLATSNTPASGKTTVARDVPLLLAFNPWKVGKLTTEPALRNKYLERIRPNPVADDIGKIFGDGGTNGRTSMIYALLIDCYREDGTVSVSRNGSTQELPSYGMAFMNGLKNAVPNDLFTRSIWFQMEEAPTGLELRDALDSSVRAYAKNLRDAMHSWAGSRAPLFTEFMRGGVRFVHPALEKRKRQIWGPVFAVAHAAGGDWPRRIFDAFVSIALDASERPVPLPEQRCLLDTADLLLRHGYDRLFAADLLAMLRALPQGHYYREADDVHLLRSLFPEALGASKVITATAMTGPNEGQRGRAKGWDAAPVLEAAADLRDMLFPPVEPPEDELEEDLQFTPSVVMKPIRQPERKRK